MDVSAVTDRRGNRDVMCWKKQHFASLPNVNISGLVSLIVIMLYCDRVRDGRLGGTSSMHEDKKDIHYFNRKI
jgi:hypothetical protein